MCHNNFTIKLSKNPIMHGSYKHIDVRFHFLRELTKDGTIEMSHCSTEEELVDVLTKLFKLQTFYYIKTRLKVCDV